MLDNFVDSLLDVFAIPYVGLIEPSFNAGVSSQHLSSLFSVLGGDVDQSNALYASFGESLRDVESQSTSPATIIRG